MKKASWKWVLCVVLVAFVLIASFGCTSSGTTPDTEKQQSGEAVQEKSSAQSGKETENAKENKVLRIGVNDSLTGSGAPYGFTAERAARLACKQLNEDGGIQIGEEKYTVEIVSYDNKSDAGEAVSSLQKMIDIDGLQFILGWSSSSATLASAQMLPNKEVSIVIGNARSPEILLYNSSGNLWRSATGNSYDPIADCQYIKDMGIDKIAILAFLNDSGYSVHVNNMVETFKKIGVEVTVVENFEAGQSDFLSQMTNIVNSSAQAYYSAGNLEESAMAHRQLRELGSDIPMFTFAGGTGEQWMQICSTDQMEGCYTISVNAADIGSENDAEAKSYIEAYKKEYGGEEPAKTASNVYDNFWILMAAYQKAGTTDWAEVNKALGELSPSELDARTLIKYDEIDGKLFDNIGQAYQAYHVRKWDRDKQDWVYEATIGKDLGPSFLHHTMLKIAEEKDIPLPKPLQAEKDTM